MGHKKRKSTTEQTAKKSRIWLGKNHAILRFGFLFGGFVLLYYVVALLPIVDRALFPAYLRANARASSTVLNMLGQHSRVENATIRTPRFSMTIKRGCDALEPSWLFCAAVLAFPATWRRRLPGLLIGVCVILALNLVRIVSLYFFGIHAPAFFETMHLEVWPVIFILVALLLWFGWVSWSRPKPLVPPNAPA